MGNLCGSTDNSVKNQRQKDKDIEAELRQAKDFEMKSLKLLLLGAGESGKSTIFKQAKLIHDSGYTNADREKYLTVVHQNCIEFMHDLLKGANGLGYEIEAEYQADVEAMNNVTPHDTFSKEIADRIKRLWGSPILREAYSKRSQFQLADSTQYFFDQIDKIIANGYLPSDQDILHSRVRSTGVVEMQFKVENSIFRLFDAGGQRNERRKWIHFFQDVHAVLFVTALSEYDQVLYENARQNRMFESLAVFSEICNMPVFRDTALILFLNKKDLFEQKIKNSELSKTFPEFTGGSNYEEGVEFVKGKFLALNHNPKKEIFVHVTCATDTNNMRFVLEAVEQIILNQNLSNSGIL
eukprot:c19004_g2_i1.p1 GENE.c19004_g2_i1~~c19004_g2_i1.p1  ORF type:complete len:353 (-),score=93.98 c19004_g2_i1:785-1843(-)